MDLNVNKAYECEVIILRYSCISADVCWVEANDTTKCFPLYKILFLA